MLAWLLLGAGPTAKLWMEPWGYLGSRDTPDAALPPSAGLPEGLQDEDEGAEP